jgi:uncharacterized protein YndB with AHSA1/START domain
MNNNSVLSYVIYIATAPEKLWTALTNGEFTRRYFFGRSVESSWKVGLPVKYWQQDGTLDVSGRVLVCDPPRFVSFTWHVEWLEEFRKLPETVVTFRLDPLGENNVVRLTLEEFHPVAIDPKYLEGGRRGWPIILSGLKSLLETGQPLPECDWLK